MYSEQCKHHSNECSSECNRRYNHYKGSEYAMTEIIRIKRSERMKKRKTREVNITSSFYFKLSYHSTLFNSKESHLNQSLVSQTCEISKIVDGYNNLYVNFRKKNCPKKYFRLQQNIGKEKPKYENLLECVDSINPTTSIL